jgi:GDPmannose 4,6-dehydratase
MKAIIFGANGQDGYYLNKRLLALNCEVTGVSRTGSWHHADVADYSAVESLIKTVQPDFVFHLAANSTTRHDVQFENHATICNGTLNILESVKLHAPGAKVFLSGSGLQFENNGTPIHETAPFAATSAYAVSRIQSVYAARYYRSLGIKAYVGYFFNHESPRRPERHISKKIACAARRISLGSRESISLGDISVRKEWTFADDVMEAILILLQQETVFEAVVGSGLAYSIEDWLDVCFEKIGVNWREHFVPVDNFKPEYHTLVSAPTTIQNLGWMQKVSFEQLAEMMLRAE